MKPFDPSTSDGCTGVRDWARHCCVVHDEGYHYGLSEGDRKRADRRLRECIHEFGQTKPSWQKPFWWALGHIRYLGVRLFGRGAFYSKPHKQGLLACLLMLGVSGCADLSAVSSSAAAHRRMMNDAQARATMARHMRRRNWLLSPRMERCGASLCRSCMRRDARANFSHRAQCLMEARSRARKHYLSAAPQPEGERWTPG